MTAISYIFALLVVGGVAAFKFGRLAESKGYVAAKARRYPLLLTLAAISGAVIVYMGSVLIGTAMPNLAFPLYHAGNWFVIAMNLLILNKAYKNMSAAPDARK